MARVIDENLRRHWNLVLGTCIKYYPARLKVGAEQAADREKMYRFKDGTDQEEAARWTASQLASRFGDKVRSIVFACIPASSAEKNRIRYEAFSQRVCELCGAVNGFPFIKVKEDADTLHESRNKRSKMSDRFGNIEIEGSFFRGKEICCYDDCLTSGKSWNSFANKLESLGAVVLGAYFYGKTTYKM